MAESPSSPTSVSSKGFHKRFGWHECNAYCSPPKHVSVGWDDQPDPEIFKAHMEERFERDFGCRLLAVEPAPEAPPCPVAPSKWRFAFAYTYERPWEVRRVG